MHDTDADLSEMRTDAMEAAGFGIAVAEATEAERRLIAPRVADPFRKDITESRISRVLDVVLALGLILVLAPVMAVTALAVLVTDPGPVVFSHRRIGRAGKRFNCYKYRTMRVDAEQRLRAVLAQSPELRRQWHDVHKLQHDPRVTLLGRWLRVTCLDELPQLFNVLMGDMSLVGPRPIVEAELWHYGHHIASYCSVRPGLTGLWQVTRSDCTSYRRRVAADVLYVRRKSLALDLRILLATVPAVLLGRGAC